jgi:hypothetical protein
MSHVTAADLLVRVKRLRPEIPIEPTTNPPPGKPENIIRLDSRQTPICGAAGLRLAFQEVRGFVGPGIRLAMTYPLNAGQDR